MNNGNDSTEKSSGGTDSKPTDSDQVSGLVDSASTRASENPSLGTHLGHEVLLAIRRDPPNSVYPDEFAVNLYIPQEGGDNIDIATVDTTWPGLHIDRHYLPEGHEQRKHDTGLSVSNPAGAVKYMTDQQRWKEWVERYDENHGLP